MDQSYESRMYHSMCRTLWKVIKQPVPATEDVATLAANEITASRTRISELEAELKTAKEDLDRANKPWNVVICTPPIFRANAKGWPDLSEPYEATIIDTGYSSRVLVVESKELNERVLKSEAEFKHMNENENNIHNQLNAILEKFGGSVPSNSNFTHAASITRLFAKMSKDKDIADKALEDCLAVMKETGYECEHLAGRSRKAIDQASEVLSNKSLLKISSLTSSSENGNVVLDFSAREIEALEEICKSQELSKNAAVRQALRVYQMYILKARSGLSMCWRDKNGKIEESIGFGCGGNE